MRAAVGNALSTPGPPDAIAVEVTNSCNLTCIMCPRTLAGVNVGLPHAILSERVWADVVGIAGRVPTITLNGLSENLLHPRFLELAEEIEQRGARIVFTTNGTLVSPEVAARIGRLKRLHSVNVSIDSADPDEYRLIRGGNLKRTTVGLQNLVAATSAPTHVSASAVVMKASRRGLPLLPEFLRSVGVRNLVLQAVVDPRRSVPDHELPEDAAEVVADLKREGARLGLTVVAVPYLESRLRGEQSTTTVGQGVEAGVHASLPRTKVCTAPWEAVAVDWRGRVFPCCNTSSWEGLVPEDELTLGDLSRQSFAEVWHGPAFRRFREGLLAGRLPGPCRICPVIAEGVHPFVRMAAKLVLEQSGPSRSGIRLVVRNIGQETWTAETRLKVAPSRPRDRASPLWTHGWLSWHRAATMREERVIPGQTATFDLPLADGRLHQVETFQVLAEGLCWVPNSEFEVVRGRRPFPGWPFRRARYAVRPAPGLV